jgi:hypothetical protein
MDGKNINYRKLESYLLGNPKIEAAIYKCEEFCDDEISLMHIDRIADLRELSGIDLLECIALLLEISALSRSQFLVSSALRLYAALTVEIAEVPELKLVFPEFLIILNIVT